MTTEKPFRPRMTREEALAEIERESGEQFHPVVARAFVAVQRGQDPGDVLTAEELTEIRDAAMLPMAPVPTLGEVFRGPEVAALTGGALVLVGLGTTLYPVAVAGVIVTLVGLRTWHSARRRIARLARALAQTADAGDQAQMFGSLVDVVDRPVTWPLSYAAFVEWNEDGSGGTVRFERGSHQPPESSIVSWLLREAESGAGLVIDEGVELPSAGYWRPCRCAATTACSSGSSSSARNTSRRATSSEPWRARSTRSGPRSARPGRRRCSGCWPRTR